MALSVQFPLSGRGGRVIRKIDRSFNQILHRRSRPQHRNLLSRKHSPDPAPYGPRTGRARDSFLAPPSIRREHCPPDCFLIRLKTRSIRFSLRNRSFSPRRLGVLRGHLGLFTKRLDPRANGRMPDPQIRRNLTPSQAAGLSGANCIPIEVVAVYPLSYPVSLMVSIAFKTPDRNRCRFSGSNVVIGSDMANTIVGRRGSDTLTGGEGKYGHDSGSD